LVFRGDFMSPIIKKREDDANGLSASVGN